MRRRYRRSVTTSAVAEPAERVLTWATLPLYLGGFLGPFGTMVVIAIYPELRESFDATSGEVNWSFSGYLVPMALLMLVSGTLGERYGRRRVTRITFLSYGVASLVCVVAPTLGLFIGARVLQGIANAFISPLLLAGLTEQIAPHRLGRAIGVYTSFQAAGGALAPLAGGVAAAFDWRLVFVLVAGVALVLSMRPPDGAPRPAASAPSIRPLLTRRMVLLWTASFTAAAGPIGAAVIMGLYLRDELDTGSTAAGIVLLLGGLVMMGSGPVLGRLLDTWGPVRSSAVATIAASAVIAPLGLIGGVGVVTLWWMLAGAALAFVIINLQNLAAIAVPENRGGALSSVMAFRFIGLAVGPLVWVPLFESNAELAFLAIASIGVLSFLTLVPAARSSLR